MNGSLCHVGPRRGCAHVTVIRFGPDAQPGINSELAGGRHRSSSRLTYLRIAPLAGPSRADLAYSVAAPSAMPGPNSSSCNRG
jgi:hypothetical protein